MDNAFKPKILKYIITVNENTYQGALDLPISFYIKFLTILHNRFHYIHIQVHTVALLEEIHRKLVRYAKGQTLCQW
jgi:hypothetical protein